MPCGQGPPLVSGRASLARFGVALGPLVAAAQLVAVASNPVTIMAGMMRQMFPVFLALVTAVKVGRHLAPAAITLG